MSLTHTVYIGPYAEVHPEPDATSWGDFTDTIKDALSHHQMPTGEHVWMLNHQRIPPRRMYFHPREEEASVVIESSQGVDEVQWFARVFAKELTALKAAYCFVNVRIRWGVLIMTD